MDIDDIEKYLKKCSNCLSCQYFLGEDKDG